MHLMRILHPSRLHNPAPSLAGAATALGPLGRQRTRGSVAAAALMLLQTVACGEDGPASPPADGVSTGTGEWVGAPPHDSGPSDAPEGVDAGVPAAPEDAGAAMNGQADADSGVPATFETLRFVIRQSPCLGAGCHNDDQNPLDLRADDQLYARLTSQVSMHCGNLPIVSPGDPQDSALLRMLRGPCGPTPRMPIGCVEDGDGVCLPPEYVSAIERWIAAGAPER